jgi:hypothetical protein
VREIYMERKHTHIYRDGDSIVTITIERTSAIVEFKNILASVDIKPDEDYDPLDGDTYAHDLVAVPDYVSFNWRKAQAFVNTGVKWNRIVLKDDPLDPGSCGAPGMSKQVRYEFAARVKARLLEAIRLIYAGDFDAYGVVCDFRGFHASLWGIEDDWAYANTEVRQEIAEEVAHDMEKAGYTVTGYPPVQTRAEKHEQLRAKIRRNMGGLTEQETP